MHLRNCKHSWRPSRFPRDRTWAAERLKGLVGLGRTATLGSYSARIDQALGSWGTFFARYVRAPSSSYSTQINASQGISDWRSTTLGITAGRSHVIHEIPPELFRAPISALRMQIIRGAQRSRSLAFGRVLNPAGSGRSGRALLPCCRNRPTLQVCGECPSRTSDSSFLANMARADKINGNLPTRFRYK